MLDCFVFVAGSLTISLSFQQVSSHDMRFHLSDKVSAMVIMLVVQKNSDKMQGAGGGGGLKPMNG